MKISKANEAKIISGILPQLIEPFFEPSKEYKKVKGQEMIDQGSNKDRDGRLVVAQQWYTVEREVLVKVNHKRRITSIIKASPNEDTMTTEIALYVNTYGLKNIQPEEESKDQIAQQ